MLYFAYGSNMCTARLARRVPSVRVAGVGRLAGYRLAWHLKGGDGSGKCNIVATGHVDDAVYGALFELAADRLDDLHAAEGPAYEFLELPVSRDGETVTSATYRGRPEWLDDTLVPFAWYRDFVVEGAREHALPSVWTQWLDGVAVVPDPDRERAAANRRILRETPTNRLP